ncbi:hypothetical protein PUN28_015419 [Cardiocondyla obscurior]|uniref:Uncharacterized protein n=1 Tax=Cardiocondyla obscurior TaxID=286306 RepID=A0AAW2EZ05_9HYME
MYVYEKIREEEMDRAVLKTHSFQFARAIIDQIPRLLQSERDRSHSVHHRCRGIVLTGADKMHLSSLDSHPPRALVTSPRLNTKDKNVKYNNRI